MLEHAEVGRELDHAAGVLVQIKDINYKDVGRFGRSVTTAQELNRVGKQWKQQHSLAFSPWGVGVCGVDLSLQDSIRS